MGSIYPTSDTENFIRNLRKDHSFDVFIETGTHIGLTVMWAHNFGFRKIYTVEKDPEYWNGLKENFKSYSNVVYRFGDSRDHLPVFLKEVDEPAFIWLDAHSLYDIHSYNPVLDEIAIIAKCPIPHIVAVDDADLFDKGEGKPTSSDIYYALEATGRTARILKISEYGVILGMPKNES